MVTSRTTLCCFAPRAPATIHSPTSGVRSSRRAWRQAFQSLGNSPIHLDVVRRVQGSTNRRVAAVPPSQRLRPGETGTALLCALLVTALITTLGASLVALVVGEHLVSAHHRASQEGLYAADAGVERAIGELRWLPAWQAVPSAGFSSSSSDFNDGAFTATLADGTVLDVARLTAERQAESDAFYPNAPDRPVWRLFAHAFLDRITGTDTGSSPPYVVVWIADDPDDLDADPSRDSNDVLIVRSQVFGVRHIRRSVEATVRRRSAIDAAGAAGALRTDVEVIAWREVR